MAPRMRATAPGTPATSPPGSVQLSHSHYQQSTPTTLEKHPRGGGHCSTQAHAQKELPRSALCHCRSKRRPSFKHTFHVGRQRNWRPGHGLCVCFGRTGTFSLHKRTHSCVASRVVAQEVAMSGEQPRKLGNSGSGSGGRLKVSAPEFVVPSRASQPPRQPQGVQGAQFGDQGSYLTGSGLPVVASAGMPAFSTQLAHGAASVGSMGAPGGMVAMDGMQSMGQGPMYAGDAGMGMEAHAPPMLQGGQDATPWHQRVFQHLLAPATAMRFDALNGRLWCGLETVRPVTCAAVFPASP